MYTSGIDCTGCDPVACATTGICALSLAGSSVLASASSTGVIHGVTLVPVGGRTDNTTTCTIDTSHITFDTSSTTSSVTVTKELSESSVIKFGPGRT